MKVYSPSDIADVLGVQASTLRNYAKLLESAGHSFQRNNRNQRWYKDDDLVLFRKIVSLKDSTDMKLKECAEATYLWSVSGEIAPPNTVLDSDTERHEIAELKELIHQQYEVMKTQNEVMQSLANKLDKQQKTIEKYMINSSNELIETKEEAKSEEVKPKKEKESFFSRVFKR